METKLTISYRELYDELRDEGDGQSGRFPKYTTQIINLANKNAQGTRPKVVGQLSDLFQEFPGRTYKEWVEWYCHQKPAGVGDATCRIMSMLQKLKEALEAIDEPLVRAWVEDLVLTKTFCGLGNQKLVLMRIAKAKGLDYRLATPEEEAKGIDGFIDSMAVSIKPESYKTMPMLQENIKAKIVYYTKAKDGINVEFDF